MAAPTPTTRVTPSGFQPMKDGYRMLIAFALNPSILFWELGGNSPGFDGGDMIETTNMHTGTWRTMRPRQLITLTPIILRVAYTPWVYPQIEAMCNEEQAITFHFSSGNYVAFFGALNKFETGDHTEGAQPEATATITPTNFDPVGLVPAGPVTGTSA